MRDLILETGETASLAYELRDAQGQTVDISGISFTFAAKTRHTEASYMVEPVSGTIDDAPGGRFSFEVTMPLVPFAGVYSVLMQDGTGKRTVLTERGGAGIRVIESLID